MYQHLKTRWARLNNALAMRQRCEADLLEHSDHMLRDIGLIRHHSFDGRHKIRRSDLTY